MCIEVELNELPSAFRITVELHRQQMLGQIKRVSELLEDPENLKYFVRVNLSHYEALVKT